MLYVSATTDRILLGAEEMKMQKEYQDGFMREITLADIDFYKDSGLGTRLKMALLLSMFYIHVDFLKTNDSYNYKW